MNNTNVQPTQGRTRRNGRTRTLPRPRSGRSIHLIWLVAALLIIGSVLTADTDGSVSETTIVLVSFLLPLLFVVELGLRAFYAVEEYHHLITRYENSIIVLLKDLFYFNSSSIAILVVSVSFFIITYMNHNQFPHKLWYDLGPITVLLSLLATLFLKRNINLQNGPLYDSFWIENSPGLDYGSGMAHSFFHGYLKLVIPKTGTQEKHLEELMQDYESKHHVRLAFYKLFILIPKSLYCFTSLMDTEFSPSIEESSSLDPKIITVAGVQNRVYKNSVYKIKTDRNPNGDKIYVCAEYATPLKTFKDVVSYNGEHSNYYKKHKNDIVLQFYLTLKMVLKEHENCTNYCELIFYDDKDENDRYKDVGQVLLQRIRKLQRMTQERYRQ